SAPRLLNRPRLGESGTRLMTGPGRIDAGVLIATNCAYFASSNTTRQALRDASITVQTVPLMLDLAAVSCPNGGWTVHGISVGKISTCAAAGLSASNSMRAARPAAEIARISTKLDVTGAFNIGWPPAIEQVKSRKAVEF